MFQHGSVYLPWRAFFVFNRFIVWTPPSQDFEHSSCGLYGPHSQSLGCILNSAVPICFTPQQQTFLLPRSHISFWNRNAYQNHAGVCGGSPAIIRTVWPLHLHCSNPIQSQPDGQEVSPKRNIDKGQLILKCPFGVFKSSKKPMKFVPGFLP